MDTRTIPQFDTSAGDDLRTLPELADLDSIAPTLRWQAAINHRASVSVIVPTFFNAGLKQRSLTFLLAGIECSQNVREVILVSSDGEHSNFADLLPLLYGRNLRVAQAEPHNRSQSRNNGARLATGDYLLFLDDDMLLKNWHLADVIVSELIERRFDCALFPPRNYLRFPALYDRYCLEDLIISWRAERCAENPFFFDPLKQGTTHDLPLLFCYPGCFTMIRRDAFEALGGFDESYLGWGFEDADFGLRAMQQLAVLNLFRKSEPLLHIDHPVSPYKSHEFRTNYVRFHRDSLRLNMNELCRVVVRGEDFQTAARPFRGGEDAIEPFERVAQSGVPLPLAELEGWFTSLAEQQIQRYCQAARPDYIVLHGSRGDGTAHANADYDLLCLYHDGGIQEFLRTRGDCPVEIECADMRAFKMIAAHPAKFDHRGVLDLAKLARGKLLWGNQARWQRWRDDVLRTAVENGCSFWKTLGLGLRLHEHKHGATIPRFSAALSAIESAARAGNGNISVDDKLESYARSVATLLDHEYRDWRERTRRSEKLFPLQIPEVWSALHWLMENVASRRARPRSGRRVANAENSDAGLVLICTVEPMLPQIIGAALQALSFRPVQNCRHVVRIVDGHLPQYRNVIQWLREFEITPQTVAPQGRNRYLNKWLALESHFLGATAAAVIDWDILNIGADGFPQPVGGTVSARKNPADSYTECAARIHDLAPQCWDGLQFRCAINSGFVLAAPAVLAQVARRTISLVDELRQRDLGNPPWHAEQLAASIAAGECGLTALGDEWNVTPQSPVADADVRLWHYNDGIETTRTIKLKLDQPDFVLEALADLEPNWPTAVRRFRELYQEVIDRVPRLLKRRPASRRALAASA